jgi:hypothetical protein
MENAIVEEFSALVGQCQGKVVFVSDEGDRLVADSMLSALVGFATILANAKSIPLHIECEQPEDCQRFIDFAEKYGLGQSK